MNENKKLRDRIETLESNQKEDDPQFSTPTGDQKEAETSKEAVRPPKECHSGFQGAAKKL